MRIDSVAQTVTLTSLALFLSSGLSSVTCASVYGTPPAESSHSTMERWQQPCGEPVAVPNCQLTRRHNVHRTLKRVRTQLKVAQSHFRMHLKDVHKIYFHVYKMLEEQYRMPWLPEEEFEWYFREVWCLEKGKKADRALPHLLDSLQRFAITFEHLQRFGLESNIYFEDRLRRNEIISETNTEIIRVLCEVETAIQNLGLQVPHKNTKKIVTESSDWAEKGDLTIMLIQDWGVIRLYQTFLNAWTKAFRNATQRGPGTCDPNRSNPISKNVGKRPGAKGKRIPRMKKQRRPLRKHQEAGENSSSSKGQQNGAARNRPMRNRQKKPVGM